MNRWKTLTVGVVIGAAVWGTALAAIPDSGGVIHGCYDTKHGDLRVIDTEAGQTCDQDEASLSWNQTGPQGPGGPPGPQGPAGPSGSTVVRLRGTVRFDDPNDQPKTLTFTWTQPANAVDWFSGKFDTTCENGTVVDVFVDGQRLGGSIGVQRTGILYFWPSSSDAAAVPYLFEPGTDTVRTMTVRLGDACPFIVSADRHTGSVAINVEQVS